jgi:hypothetical protein
MRKVAVAFVYMAFALSCRGSLLGGAPSHDETRPKVATLTGVAGSVQVLRAGGVDWSPIKKGAELFDDDRLRTFKAATAELAFPNGSSLRVDEESLIALGGGILVERGSVEGELQPGLKLRTPSAETESARARDIVIQ